MHIEFLLEEESCEAALNKLVPRIVGHQASFRIHVFQGKQDLLHKLPQRLRGYSSWISHRHRIVVLVDRDDDDCRELKASLEETASNAGLFWSQSPKPARKIPCSQPHRR
jgi:hypothetical protein